ncbi:MAG: mechanosensitive ion channel family protein [Spirulina sp.]
MHSGKYSPKRLGLRRWGRWMRRRFVLAALLVSLTLTGLGTLAWAEADVDPPAVGQDPARVETVNADSMGRALPETVVGNKVDGYPVLLDGQELFRVRVGVEGVATAEERAAILTQRIQAVVADSSITPDQIRAEAGETQSMVWAGDKLLFTVLPADEEVYGRPHPELAVMAADWIQQALITYREARTLKRLATNLAAIVVSTLLLILFLRGLFFLCSQLLSRIQRQRENGTLALRFQSIQILGAGATSYLLHSLIQLLRMGLLLFALYLYVPFVLSQFPATQALGDSLLRDLADRLNGLAQAFVAYLPNLMMLGILALVTYYVIEFAKQVIIELGRQDVYPWFYSEWVKPTIRLATFLIIAMAFVFAAPFMPGFGSPAFQGVSLFLGALLTLGSSSAVANALAGVILIYTRAFRIGDLIRIDNIIGDVQDKSLFVTRVLTPRQETVTIPNASVLNSNVTNFSAICREAGGYLVLQTTITLGYDVPWRKIHEVLIEAALATPNIQATPAPFVLQTALNDFNVSYTLSAYTAVPNKMPLIYSALHQNIQDYCNAADIEILSPGYTALRDGNHSTIPADYLPEGYIAPAFGVKQR